MNNLLHAFAEYPVLIGVVFFLVISLLLAVFLGFLMRRAGVSLKPLVFFFGFLAIIVVPQLMFTCSTRSFTLAKFLNNRPKEQEPIPRPPRQVRCNRYRGTSCSDGMPIRA